MSSKYQLYWIDGLNNIKNDLGLFRTFDEAKKYIEDWKIGNVKTIDYVHCYFYLLEVAN